MPSSKTQNKRDAIAHVVGILGTDMFTTHEVFHTGQRLIRTNHVWPRYLKRAFSSIRNPEQMGTLLSRHPAFGKEDGGNHKGAISTGSYINRLRTQLWRVR